MVAIATLLESATLTARMEMVEGEGRMGGAVNTPSGEIVPCTLLPPGMPETLQVTEVLEVFDTVAANAALFPSNTEALVGVTLIATGGWPGGAGGGLGVVVPAHPATNAQSAAVTQTGARRHPPCARAPNRFPEVMD
jgi:hypothetical protein